MPSTLSTHQATSQLRDTTVMETSSGEAVAAHDGGEVIMMDANSGEEYKGKEGGGEEESDKINNSCGGNRWPRQETLALLKIRSDMDAIFRDSSLKGPLWEEVARKLAELGYHRSAKKCKEKFENVYKYHKRTKESRSGKHEGKTYKFFDQLQALEKQFTVSYPPKPQPTLATTNTVALPPPPRPSDTTAISYVTTTVPSTNPTVVSPSPPPPTNATITSPTVVTNPRNPPQPNNNKNNIPYSLPNMNNLFSTTSTSSSTASDEDLEEKYRKKRKWKDYFRRLTRQVLAKQEEMQKRFLEAIDKREREHVAQQEAWRIQEMERINREHELLVQERSTAAAKNAAVIAFLQQLSGQHQNPTTQPGASFLQQPPPPQVSHVQPPPPQQQAPQPPAPLVVSNSNINVETQKMNNGHSVFAAPVTPTAVVNATSTVVTTTPTSLSSLSSSRWPKAEVHALIRLRTSLEAKYQENGPKAPLWEDISAGMLRLGYNRSAKRCKEKWENINKYFKKVKEGNKQRREDSKTCPYFHELDALYKEKGKTQNPFGILFQNMKPHEMMEPLMVQPEQQWRPPSQYEQGAAKENDESGYERTEREDEEGEDDEEEEDDNEEGDLESVEDEGGSRYEIATNKLSSMDTVE
ncbi:hypothetical protein VNO78_19672 [Psophocarpus tetragonolobus]|uniref:Myb-like domain-containing protein n=1 Tax=Psophocarpus tetragonolobus TaxID=3891 RepID=A0AAN9S9H4_PSOTE